MVMALAPAFFVAATDLEDGVGVVVGVCRQRIFSERPFDTLGCALAAPTFAHACPSHHGETDRDGVAVARGKI